MITALRITAFICTLLALAGFLGFYTQNDILHRQKSRLIAELENERPQREEIESIKESIASWDNRVDAKKSIIQNIGLIYLSFVLSEVSRYMKKRKTQNQVIESMEASSADS